MLVFFGWLLIIYLAENDEQTPNFFDIDKEYGKQFIWIILSIVLSIFIFITGYTIFTYRTHGMFMLLILVVL